MAEVTARFPGHVLAQQRRVAMLRAGTDKAALQDALFGLALSTRAAGDLDDAKHAASEAQALGEMPEKTLGILQEVGLLESAGPAPEPAPAAAPEPTPVAAPPAEAPPAESAPSDVLIDLDSEVEVPAPLASASPTDDDEEDDLSAIAAALDGGLLAEGDAQPLTPDAGSEQSIDEVFAAFKERVNEEVASDDFRTHYDLAIGYKEMGLFDAAIEEFQTAAGAPELRRDAMVMMGDCHRDQGEAESAVRCYRGALAAGAGADPAILTPVRYELASLLADSGESAAALDAFREVQASDPDFRDVGSRIDALESQLTA